MSRYDKNEKSNALDELWRLTHDTRGQTKELGKRSYVGTWMNPVYQNAWTNAGTPYKNYQYRLLFSDTFQTRGAINGGATGTVVYTVAEPWRSDADIAWVGSVVTTGFVPATFKMNSVTGQVTVTF